MKYLTLLRANIRKQKGSYLAILLLSFVIALTLGSVLSLWCNAKDYLYSELDRVSFGDLSFWISEPPEIDDLLSSIEELSDVDTVNADRLVRASGSIHDIMLFAAYDPSESPFHVFQGDSCSYTDTPPALSDGEVYVPVCFRTLTDAKVGDSFTADMADNSTCSFVIRGFFEDPIAGSSTVGIKHILVNDDDLQRLYEKSAPSVETTDTDASFSGYLIHITQAADSTLSLKELQQKLNSETDLGDYVWLASSSEQMAVFMLVLQLIFMAFLITFAVVLLFVALLVLSHNINSSIEQEYVSLGILKALGFTGRDLRLSQCLFYLSALCIGLVCGLFASHPLIAALGTILVPVTGILPPNRLPVMECLLVFGAIVALIVLFLLVKTAKISKIRPISAIRGGSGEVFWNGRFLPGLHGKGLSFWLAIRQLFSGKKQYVGACLVTALLVFFLSLCGRIQSWIGDDGRGISTAMSIASVDGEAADFGVLYPDTKTQECVEETITNASAILASYDSISRYVKLEDMDYMMNVISDPEYFHILQGRTCLYDNEVVITDIVADDMDLQIGDTVKVTLEGKNAEYIISGIYQCANELGSTFGMSQDGYAALDQKTDQFYKNYVLADHSVKESLCQDLTTRYDGQITVEEYSWSGIDGIVGATRALFAIMYAISMVFSMIVVYMTGSKILFQEQHNLSIYKALGFCSRALRFSFAIRFALISVIGALLGTVLSITLTDPAASQIFRLFGISSFHSSLDATGMLLPALFIVVIFFLCAYAVSGKLKRVDAAELIAE